jgi:hypothetical protein
MKKEQAETVFDVGDDKAEAVDETIGKPGEPEETTVDDLVIKLGDVEGDDDDGPADSESGKSARSDEQRPSKRERRRQRYDEMSEARARAEARADAIAQENEKLRQMAFSAAQQPVGRSAPEKDEFEEETKELDRRAQEIYEAYTLAQQAKTLTPEMNARYLETAKQIQRKQTEIVVRQQLRVQEAARPRPNPQQPQIDAIRMANIDVFSNERATMYANAPERGVGRAAKRSDL